MKKIQQFTELFCFHIFCLIRPCSRTTRQLVVRWPQVEIRLCRSMYRPAYIRPISSTCMYCSYVPPSQRKNPTKLKENRIYSTTISRAASKRQVNETKDRLILAK